MDRRAGDKRDVSLRDLVTARARETGRTVSDVLNEAGLGKSWLKDVSQGRSRAPRSDSILKLAKALDLPPFTLFNALGIAYGEVEGGGVEDHGSTNSDEDASQLVLAMLAETVTVREVAIEAAAGGSRVVSSEEPAALWSFPVAFVRTLTAKNSRLEIVTICGDSMVSDPPKPRDLLPGGKILVNLTDRTPSPPGVFLLDDGLGLVCKRVEHVVGSDPPHFRVTSNNPAYTPFELGIEETRIIGRVVGRWERVS